MQIHIKYCVIQFLAITFKVYLRLEQQASIEREKLEVQLNRLRCPWRLVFVPGSGCVNAFKCNWYASVAIQLASKFGVCASLPGDTSVCWKDMPEARSPKLK